MSSTGQGMSFFYGDYVHQKGEVYPEAIEIIPRFSPEGLRWAADYIWRLRGNFFQDPAQSSELTPAQVGQKIETLRTAYNQNDKDVGFYLPDGSTISKHYMRSSDTKNLSGNRVTRRSWDNLTEGEYANTRSFSMTIQALFEMSESDILSFKEGTSRTGTGGPTWKVRANWRGEPYKHFLTSKSKVVHIQQGEIISMNGWITPPGPYWPKEEMQEHRVVTMHTPQYHGNGKGTHYRVTYKYVFERLGPDANFSPSNGYQ